jgi:GAF domain-containing protein
VGDIALAHLARLVAFSESVLFVYDTTDDVLVAQHVIGEATATIAGLRVAPGQRLSGWVGANRQTILNSDPALDLGEAARLEHGRLRSCMSTALVLGDQLLGVLTIYSPVESAYAAYDRAVFEAAAGPIGDALRRASDAAGRRDAAVARGRVMARPLARYPNLQSS